MSPHQLELGTPKHNDAWQVLRKLLQSAVDQIGLKQCAYDLDTSPSYLSNCLNERDRHHFPARWLPYLIINSKTDDLLKFLALVGGKSIGPRKQLTDAERVQKLEKAIASLGEPVKRLVHSIAYEGEEE